MGYLASFTSDASEIIQILPSRSLFEFQVGPEQLHALDHVRLEAGSQVRHQKLLRQEDSLDTDLRDGERGQDGARRLSSFRVGPDDVPHISLLDSLQWFDLRVLLPGRDLGRLF